LLLNSNKKKANGMIDFILNISLNTIIKTNLILNILKTNLKYQIEEMTQAEPKKMFNLLSKKTKSVTNPILKKIKSV